MSAEDRGLAVHDALALRSEWRNMVLGGGWGTHWTWHPALGRWRGRIVDTGGGGMIGYYRGYIRYGRPGFGIAIPLWLPILALSALGFIAWKLLA